MRAQIATLRRCFVAIMIVTALANVATVMPRGLARQGGHRDEMLAALARSRTHQSTSRQELTKREAPGTKSEIAARAELYERWRSNRKINQKIAYEAGKEYLRKYPDDEEYGKYVRKFVEEYEHEARKEQFKQLIANKKYDEVFALGKQVLAVEPEDVKTVTQLAWAGLSATTSGSTTLTADTINYADSAIKLIEAGKTPEDWKPFTSKDDTLGWLNYALGVLNLKTNQMEARDYFIKAAESESSVKKEPTTYYYLAYTYEAGEYKKLADDYQARFADKTETPESKAALESLNQIVDRIIDLYARAIAYSGTEDQQKKIQWLEQLKKFYKFRNNNSTEGLDSLIANVTSKPLR